MDVDDLDRRIGRTAGDLAGRLASESLDSLSVDELDLRIELLEAEITRTRSHKAHVASHRAAAKALFGQAQSGGRAAAPPDRPDQ